jgi:nucleoside 2-deoxyribosyltransferase
MKAYITCPISHSKERWNLLPEIKRIVEEKGINTYVFEVGGDPKDIFKKDYSELKSCDLIIADVSEPSHGVGFEIGTSYSLDLKIILLLEKGKNVTKLLQGMPNTIIIKYENLKDLLKNLSLALDKINS